MDERDWLVEHFEEHRPHLRAVAYRMLGSLAEADEAVQDSCRGAAEVARTAVTSAQPAAVRIPVLVNGAAGVVVMTNGQPFVVMGFTVARGKIVEIDCFLDPERLARLDLDLRDDAF
jgi:RNA polymerase sigma-70 factor, ECF subfamily